MQSHCPIVFRMPVGARTLTRRSRLALLLGLLGICSPQSLPAQQPSIAGVVVSVKSQEPLVGAIVTLIGTTVSATTDARGRFGLVTPAGVSRGTIRVAMVGYAPATQPVTAGDQSVRIALAESAVELGELVVTGTAGAVQKRELGNVVSRVRVSEEVQVAPTASIDQLLNARAPGVVLIPPSGLAGGGSRIFIRGRASISLPTDPLIYVDGIRVDKRATAGASPSSGTSSALNDFSPEQIQSMEVIKGPAAATLYGTEANNGVIQIITKRGAQGPGQFDVSVRLGTNAMRDPSGRWLDNYYQDEGGAWLPFNIYQVEADAGRAFLRTGFTQGYALAYHGGSETAKYYAAADYASDEGALYNNKAQRTGVRLNVDLTPHAKYDINGQLGYSAIRTLFPDGVNNLMFDGVLTRPVNRNTASRGFFTAPSEVYQDNFSFNENTDHVTAGVQLRHRPTSWLSHQVRTGVDYSNNGRYDLIRRMNAEDGQFFAPITAAGSKTANETQVLSTTFDYAITATAKLSTNWRFATSGGFQYYRRNTRLLSATGQQFPTPDVTSIAGAALQFGSEDAVENITVGGYIQEQITFKDRLYLTGAVRMDRNSAFGESQGAVTYPKLSASWVVNEEQFWKVSWLPTLRLRAAYGLSGQQPDAFAALRTYSAVTTQGGNPGVTPQFVGNPDLGPEKGKELEVGFEAGFFQNRLNIDFTYYDKTTDDAIVARNVAPSSGFPSQQFVNAGQVKNKGVELLASSRVVQSRSVALDLTLNLSHNDNKVTQLGIPNTPFLEFGFGNRFQPGYPVYAFFARKVISADRAADGTITNIMCDGGTPDGLPGGAAVDCNAAPRVYRGSPEPSLEGAFTTSLTLYNRLTLSAMVDFKQNWTTWESNLWCPGILTCESEAFPDRFNPVRVASDRLGYVDDFAWEPELSFAKLREISISYALPDRWARAFGAKTGLVSVAGRNLHTWTNYEGMDPENLTGFPETFAGFGTPFTQNQLPQAAQFMVRFNFTF